MRAWYLTERRRKAGGRPRGLRALLPGWEVPFEPPPEPPPAGVSVEGVELYEGTVGDALVWRFSDVVIAAGGDLSGLQASPDGSGFVGATGAELLEDGSLFLSFAGAVLGPGSVWRITAAPPGMLFPEERPLAVPQSGVVSL